MGLSLSIKILQPGQMEITKHWLVTVQPQNTKLLIQPLSSSFWRWSFYTLFPFFTGHWFWKQQNEIFYRDTRKFTRANLSKKLHQRCCTLVGLYRLSRCTSVLLCELDFAARYHNLVLSIRLCCEIDKKEKKMKLNWIIENITEVLINKSWTYDPTCLITRRETKVKRIKSNSTKTCLIVS